MDWLTWSPNTRPNRSGRAAQLLVVLWLISSAAAEYSARTDGEVVHLEDSANQIRVSIVPRVANVAFQTRVTGKKVLRFPYAHIEEFRSRPGLHGHPSPGRWANRPDGQGV